MFREVHGDGLGQGHEETAVLSDYEDKLTAIVDAFIAEVDRGLDAAGFRFIWYKHIEEDAEVEAAYRQTQQAGHDGRMPQVFMAEDAGSALGDFVGGAPAREEALM